MPVTACQNQPQLDFLFVSMLARKNFQRADQQYDCGKDHERDKQRFLRAYPVAKSCHHDAQPIQAMNEQAREQDHIEREKPRRTRDLDERVPTFCALREQGKHKEMNIKIKHESDCRGAIENVRDHADAPGPKIEPAQKTKASEFGAVQIHNSKFKIQNSKFEIRG